MEIRKCTEQDLSLLAKLNKCLIEDEKSDNTMSEAELFWRMKGFLEKEYDAYFFVIHENIIGYGLVKNDCSPLYLRQFYIDRKYRRQHYGEQAFSCLLKYLNVTTIDIEVLSWNEAGIGFWEKMNFQERSKYMRYSQEKKIAWQEEIIETYFRAWLEKDNSALYGIFSDDIIYSECYGPEYHGIEQILKWFSDWNKIGTVLDWRIKGYVHQGNITVAEWYFKCNYNNAIEGFDGVSVIKFSNDKKIVELKEFQSKAEHYFPYGE